jgi:glycosyltransferase involved in cell wall biosynthesis
MTKITAVIITLNEEKHIGACIYSLWEVADEVLVIDSFSTDETKKIACEMGARVIEAEFTGFGPQRNIGASSATNDLILVLDADEQLSAELIKSIKEIKEEEAAAYSFNRLNFLGARSIKSAGWYPDTHVRLYDRRNAAWNDRYVHEDVEVKGEIKFLSGDLLHYSYSDIAEIKQRTMRYAKLGASVYKDKNKGWIFMKILFSPVVKFLKIYFIQLGFTDGYAGLMISYYRAQETFLKYYWAFNFRF